MRYLVVSVAGLALFLVSVLATSAQPSVVFTDATYLAPDGSVVQVDIAHYSDTSPNAARETVRTRLHAPSLAEPYALLPLTRTVPVPMAQDTTGQAAGVQPTAVRDGILGWNGISANFAYAYQGLTAGRSSLCTGISADGFNTIGWGSLGGSILAVACYRTSPEECDILVDNDRSWATVDLQTVMLHEGGHCAGLAHTDVASAVMYPSYHGVLRTPQADDRAGLCAKYGGCSVTPPTPTPEPSVTASATNTATTTATPTLTASPTPTSTASPTPAPTPTPTPIPPPVQCPIPGQYGRDCLYLGWNLLGGTGESAATYVASNLCVSIIYAWTGDQWLRYIPGAPSFANSITQLKRTQGYWIHCTRGIEP